MKFSEAKRFLKSELAEKHNDNYGSFQAAFNDLGVSFTGVQIDSRRVSDGDVFFAYPGSSHDGRDYIDHAVSRGASAVVWESIGQAKPVAVNVPNFGWKEIRKIVGQFASRFYGNPSHFLKICAVTGTNGKTTCAEWIAQALVKLGLNSASVGTLGIRSYGTTVEHDILSGQTTPDAVTLQQAFRKLVDGGVSGVAMEASSHALDQGRLDGTKIDVALFTNLTNDHLDYHGTIDEYGLAKSRLFSTPNLFKSVLNIDDEFGKEIADLLRSVGRNVVTYSYENPLADVRVKNLFLDVSGAKFDLVTPWGTGEINCSLIGRFNVQNLLAVTSVLLSLGFKFPEVCNVVQKLQPVDGRLQKLSGGFSRSVFIDYAHTPDALRQTLAALNSIKQSDAKLICVFGAGGGRDSTKRFDMGEAVIKGADVAIVTSDNPRFEDPKKIISDIVADNVDGYLIEENREAAINLAIGMSAPGDIVLIAGKGHEKYQDVRGKKIPFDDVAISTQVLRSIEGDCSGRGVSVNV